MMRSQSFLDFLAETQSAASGAPVCADVCPPKRSSDQNSKLIFCVNPAP